jgi:hypothetical protein
MATIYMTEYSTWFLIPALGTLTRWVQWGHDDAYRDIMPRWVSGGAPNDPNPVMRVEWKGLGLNADLAEVVTIKVKNLSQGGIGVRFRLIKVVN